ncbi:hypothetical protein [Vampirovibrio chlorellavorus]|uniref:hypothetical protein n=1 Tax=Vampirovibrio chlorellavorus TaxID=758823 RepID=UPI0026EDB59D|nr:hypothetical protein [Vampirovibrio chlorellavorus]
MKPQQFLDQRRLTQGWNNKKAGKKGCIINIKNDTLYEIACALRSGIPELNADGWPCP